MNASQYLRNVGKSMGYIAIDSFKHMAPNTTALFSNAKDFSSELYQTINDFKGKAVGSGTDSIKSSIKNTATESWKNARDDFLSGKWYNKERKDAADNELLKNMGFDLDFDFDLDDFGDYGDESDKAAADQSAKETEAVIGTINGSVASAANTVASVTTKSTDYLASVQNSNTAALYNLNTQGFNNINVGMNAINANISALVSLAEPLTSHMQNSAVFYAKSTEYQDKSLKLLEQLVKNTTPAQPKKSSRGVSFEDYVGDAGIDLVKLFTDMKSAGSKSIKEYKELFGMMGGSKGLTGDFTSSPIAFLMSNLLIPQLIGSKRVGKIKGIDDYLKTLGFGAYSKLSSRYNSSFTGQILSSLFGINIPEIKANSKVDTGKYEKGKVDWNGKAQKALMEVIPYYLSKMTAMMEGSNDLEVFDYEKGQFTTKGKLKAAFEEDRLRGAKSAGRDLFRKASAAGHSVTQEDLEQLSVAILLSGADTRRLFSPYRKEREEYINSIDKNSTLGQLLSKREIKDMIMKGADSKNTKGALTKYDLATYFSNIGSATVQYNRKTQEAQDAGILGAIFNEGGLKSHNAGLFGVDKNNYNALDYLRGIYLNTLGTAVNTAGKDAKMDVAKNGVWIPDNLSSTNNVAKSAIDTVKEIVTGSDKDEDETFLDKTKSMLHDIFFSETGLFGFLTDEKRGIKASFKKIGNAFKKGYFGATDVPSMYVGGVVRRTGLAALSEGEMVIPAQFNPYYRGPVNRRNQRIGENRAIGRFFGSFADGTTDVGGDKSKFNVDPNSFMGKAGNTIKEGFSDFGVMLFNLFSGVTGIGGDRGSIEDEKKNVANIIGNAAKSIKGGLDEHGSDMIVGGMIGGGISLLTGAVISPILGAAVGAGTGLLLSSEKFRDFLFGKEGEDGIFGEKSKDIRQFVEEQLPTSLIGGATGGVAGALLGHPVLGMFLGAGAGFVAKSNKVQDYLFGEIGDDGKREGGLLPAELQEKLKKALPGASAGAISGIVATALGGPFGLVGNMILGAGIGTVVTSERFKDWFLGSEDENGKREGGFIKDLRERVLDPVREIFFNLSDKIRQDIRDRSIELFEYLKKTASNIYNGPLGRGVRGGVNLLGRGVNTGFNWLTGGKNLSDVQFLPDLNRMARRRQLANLTGGYLVKDKTGRALTAQDRMDIINNINMTPEQEASFGIQSTKLLDAMNRAGTLGDLNKELDRIYELKAGEDRSSAMLSQFGIENISNSEIRKLRDAIKVERKAKSPIEIIKNKVEQIFDTLKDIQEGGIGVDRIIKTTNAGQDALKKQNARDAINQTIADGINQLNDKTEAMTGDITDPENPINQATKKKTGLFSALFGPDSVIGKAAAFIEKAGKWMTAIGLGALIVSAFGVFDKLAFKLFGEHGMGDSITGGFFGGVGGTGGTNLTDVSDVTDYSNPSSIEDAYASLSDYTYKRTDTYSFSERAKEAIVRNLPRFVSTGTEMVVHALSALRTKVADVMELVLRVPAVRTFLAKHGVKIGKYVTQEASDAGVAISRQIADGVTDAAEKSLKAGAKIGKIMSDITVAINIAMVVIDFTAGYQDAEVTMGVINPSIGQRIISGSIRAIKNLIPVVGVLVPDKLLVDIFVNCLGGVLGLDEFEAQRAEADALLAQYNLENGTELTWAQYQKDVLDNKTWTEKIWEGAKTRGGRAIETAQIFGNDVKQNGLGSALKNYVGGGLERAWEKTKETDGNILSKAWALEANVVDELMPGILGDIISSSIRALECAYKGDLAGIADVNLEVFEKTDDPITEIMSHFINPILLSTKLVAYPIGIVAKFVRDAFDTFKGTNEGIASTQKDILTANAMLSAKALSGDLPGMWKLNVKGNTGIEFIDVMQQVLLTSLKVLDTPWAAVGFAVRKAGEFIFGIGKKIGNGMNFLNEQANIGKELIHSDDSTIDQLFDIPEPGNDVLFPDLFKGAAYGTRILAVGIEVAKGAFRCVLDMIKTSSFGKTISAIETNHLNAGAKAIAGDFQGLWDLEDSNTETGFWGLLSKGGLIADKITLSTFTMVSFVAQKAYEKLKDITSSGSGVFSSIGSDIETMWSYTKEGDVVSLALHNTSVTADSNGKFWHIIAGLVNNTVKSPLAIIGTAVWAGNKVSEKLKAMMDKVKTGINYAKEQIGVGVELYGDADNTDFIFDIAKGLKFNSENPIENIFNGVTYGLRLIGAPIGLVKYGAKVLGETINEKIEAIKSDAELYREGMDSIKEIMGNSDKNFNDVLDVSVPEFSGPLSWVMKIGFNIGKAVSVAFKTVTGFIDDIKSSFNFSGIWDNLKTIANFKGSGGNSGIGGGASGFVSQRDSRYANQGLGGYNVGEMGCGPAAASMVLGNSMSSNINLARKYQTAGGTDLAYFAEAFSRNGRTPIYYNLGGGASGVDMVRDIASGKPVVLMGRDPYNNSKANSPFGPNNHYVVARGFRNGGLVIDDPEASAGGMIYDPSILNNVTAAVSAGRSGLPRRRLFGIGAGGATINGTTDQIWAFFKGMGYADGAVAGILANIQSESSFSTTAVGDSGHAYGLCQWHDYKNSSSGRYANMLATAKAMGRQVSDLTVQLTHIHNEIGQAGAGYPSISDPYQAGYNFCVNFERPSNKDSKGKSRGNLAKEFYKHYAGSTGSYNSSTSSSSSNISRNTGKLSSTIEKKPESTLSKMFKLTSSIGSAFSNAFTKSALGKFNISNLFGSIINGSSAVTLDTAKALENGDFGTISGSSDGSFTTSWPGKQPVDYMRDVLGKLRYDRSNRDPDKGGGDCSSTVAWALTKAGLPVTTDSRWQYVNSDGSTPSWQKVLWYNNGKRLGNQAIPVALQPNDVVFYGKDSSSYPDHVSHVEMYNGNNELIGHGSDPGTKIKSVNYNKENIIKIVRPNSTWGASGSGLGDLAIKPKKLSTITKHGNVYNLADYKRVSTSAGASNITGIDKSTALILKTMITLIESIVKNTDDISAIYKLLSAYCSNNSDTKSAEILSKLMSDRDTDNSRIEDNLADLKATVDSILAS